MPMIIKNDGVQKRSTQMYFYLNISNDLACSVLSANYLSDAPCFPYLCHHPRQMVISSKVGYYFSLLFPCFKPHVLKTSSLTQSTMKGLPIHSHSVNPEQVFVFVFLFVLQVPDLGFDARPILKRHPNKHLASQPSLPTEAPLFKRSRLI